MRYLAIGFGALLAVLFITFFALMIGRVGGDTAEAQARGILYVSKVTAECQGDVCATVVGTIIVKNYKNYEVCETFFLKLYGRAGPFGWGASGSQETVTACVPGRGLFNYSPPYGWLGGTLTVSYTLDTFEIPCRARTLMVRTYGTLETSRSSRTFARTGWCPEPPDCHSADIIDFGIGNQGVLELFYTAPRNNKVVAFCFSQGGVDHLYIDTDRIASGELVGCIVKLRGYA